MFLKKDLALKKYTDYALSLPMYFINRNHQYIDMTKYTFKEYLDENSNHQDDAILLKDWEDHLTTLFPQVRLKQYIEIRSMDACSWDLICSQPAFWIGILYDDEIMDNVKEITESWTQEDRQYLNKTVPQEGLQSTFKEKINLICSRFFELSKKRSKKRNRLSKNGEFDESIHMKDLEKNLENGYSPADCLINKYKLN